jgi:hypothetical protein
MARISHLVEGVEEEPGPAGADVGCQEARGQIGGGAPASEPIVDETE